jgi:orotate phosphoribosyltransferase
MRSIEALIESAERLTSNGLTQGEIADELNVSRETAQWLVEQSGEQTTDAETGSTPVDIHVDWSAVGRSGDRLAGLGGIMADMLTTTGDGVDLTVGIGNSGAPLATVISQELGTDFSVYIPSKYQQDGEDGSSTQGSFSRNFANIADQDCYIVDDNIDTGQTMTETIERIREHGATPVAAVVLTDKLGQKELSGVPVHSMINMFQVGET